MKARGRILLGFDYGKKKIGVAVGEESTATATPLETVRAIDENPDWGAITRLIQTWRPAALVVGVPLNMDGSEHDMTRAARRFANRLKGRYHLPVYGSDERLSSREAVWRLEGADKKTFAVRKSRHRAHLDPVAAQVILQTFFSAGLMENQLNKQ